MIEEKFENCLDGRDFDTQGACGIMPIFFNIVFVSLSTKKFPSK